jgi:hypothetical protein
MGPDSHHRASAKWELPMIGEYAKGIVGTIGAVAVSIMSYGDQFCGSVWPAVASVIAAVLVVAVPNKTRP